MKINANTTFMFQSLNGIINTVSLNLNNIGMKDYYVLNESLIIMCSNNLTSYNILTSQM
mgnify:CR=1 FL=1